jgi:hypothetical protein
VPSRVVLDGPVATLSMGLSITRNGALIPPPPTLAHPGDAQQPALDDLQAGLSSAVRKTFDSSQVRVQRPTFTDLAQGYALATVTVETHGTAKFSSAGFATGTTSLASELDDPVCKYVREHIGGSPPPTVEVTRSEVELGEAALTATVDEGGADTAEGLSPGERLAAQVISGVAFVVLGLFVVVVLACDLSFPLLAVTGGPA